jgi:3-oxoacyl-[acyl-carrier-protein] synthase-3
MRVCIDHLSAALGELSESARAAFEHERTLSRPEVLREAGFERHHFCAPETSALDLALRAVEDIRARLGAIDAIVYSTCLPENANVGSRRAFDDTRDVKHLMDFPASRLQAHFALDGAQVFGLAQQACTGMLGSLRLARLLIEADGMRRVLCVTADRFPPGALYEQSYNLISDGAAACVVSREPGGFELLAFHQITNGALAAASDDETVGAYFSYTHKAVRETLERAGVELEDLDWVVPQNINRKAWQILAGLLGVAEDRVWLGAVGEIGHVISADNVINLKLMDEAGLLRPGQTALLLMAGYGLNWQCALIRKAEREAERRG